MARAAVRRVGRSIHVPNPVWGTLDAELARWPAGGASFWWRDDDATAGSDALDRLLQLQTRLDVPLALAVIPARVHASLAAEVSSRAELRVLVHGWDHVDHAGPAGPKAELASGRDPGQVTRQLAAGRERLSNLFGRQVLSVLVPPFNRLAPVLAGAVRHAGFTHVSVDQDLPGLGLPSVNVHADVVDWSTGHAADPAGLVRALVIALRLRRWRMLPSTAPLGIMTHHLAHDGRAWDLCEELLARLKQHRAVTFRPLADMFVS